jgi:hypothetical protein
LIVSLIKIYNLTAAAKIRWLLALICLGLFLTAIIAKQTYSPANNLESSAKTLEGNLHQKEVRVQGLITDKNLLFKLKNIPNDEQYALSLVDIAKKERIYITIFEKGQISYWNGIRVLPDAITSVKDGSSFLKESNGYYEAVKKTDGAFSVIFYIPIKNNYSFQNSYLKNVFNPDLLQDDNIEIADFTDHNIYSIHTVSNAYLFSVKLKANDLNHLFQTIQILLWLAGMLLMCVLTNNLANYFNNKGHIPLSFAIIAGFIVCVRFIGLYFHWPDIYAEVELFDPYYYHSGWLLPSLGDCVINILLLTWFAVYVHYSRHKIIAEVKSVPASYAICISCVLLLIGLSRVLLSVAEGLVLKSKINFDVNNVLNLGFFSVIGIFILCFCFFIFLLVAEACLVISQKLNISTRYKLYVFFSFILLATIGDIVAKDYSCFYLLWSINIIILGYAVYYTKGKLDPLIYIGIIVVCSTISSVKLYTFEADK